MASFVIVVVVCVLSTWPLERPIGRIVDFVRTLAFDFERQPGVFLAALPAGALFAWAAYEVTAWGRSRQPRTAPTGIVRRGWRRLEWPAALAFFFLLFFIPAWRIAARIDAAVAEADRIAPGWRLDHLEAVRERVPDAENGALVAAEAVAKTPSGWVTTAGGSPEFDRVLDAVPEHGRLDLADVAILRDALGAVPEALSAARRLAERDRGRYEIRLATLLWATDSPDVRTAQRVAGLLKRDVALAAHVGDADAALRSSLAMLGVARSFGDASRVGPQACRLSIDALAARSIRCTLGQGEPSDAALAKVQAALLAEAGRPIARDAVLALRAMDYEVYRRLESGVPSLDSMMYGSSGGVVDHFAAWVPIFPLYWGHLRASLLEWSNELLAILDQPERDWLAAVMDWETRSARESSRWRFLDPMKLLAGTFRLMPSFVFQQLQRRAELRSLAVVIAAERHRLATGAWPASLAEIPASILPEPPTDPCTGQPLRMERFDGGLRVYSVGPNRLDEHGVDIYKSWQLRWRGIAPNDDVGATGWDVGRRGLPAEPAGSRDAAP
ncbi:hypothetical protein [Paludisphaera mucosa]|uniref:Uncharacterized protein n=1 Tax=Paludisphaera mucosa TaxID=3030827 RepID=A0ABT6FA91_9BACT|nr:hypothetical protein [Paludisphaera mucosa]MDG3004497.1 hypothetical protein [Paludisphaera mucosa]